MSRFGLKPAQAPWVRWCLGAASFVALPVTALHAQTPIAPSAPKQATFERGGVDQVQATTQALLEALVEGGILTKEKSDALVTAAKAKAAALVPFVGPDGSMLVIPPAPAPYVPVPSDTQAAGVGLPALPAYPAVLPSASRAAAEEVDKDGKKVVRIPYVSEATKKELREQVKREVLAQAKKERWGDSGAYPSWLNHVQLYGDFRLREEATILANGNTAPGYSFGQNVTRAADIVNNANALTANFNTQGDANRMRLRARLGLEATVSDDVLASMRFSTGNTTDRTSTNQTMGQSFNKYSVVFDQAYMSFRPLGPVADFRGGRMPNPFFGTDLVWADDLGFEGVSVSGKKVFGGTSEAFATAGYFPLSEFKPGTSRSRALVGMQAGASMKLGNNGNLKFGLALYDYQNVAGEPELDYANRPADYAIRYEYGAGFRQRGNTLFNVRASLDPANNPSSFNPAYGLASDFRVLNLTAALDLPTLYGFPLTVTADAVTNLSFDRAAIAKRTGLPLSDGKDSGYLARIAVGDHTVRRKGEWNAFLTYRYLGSDATLDAFTNSDFGLGGTNNQGFIVGGSYGWYDNTVLSARWMSSNQIDSYAPGSTSPTKLSVDTLQVDLAVRF